MQRVNAQSSLVVVSIKQERHAFEDKEPTELRLLQPLLLLRSVLKIITAKQMPGQVQLKLRLLPKLSNVVLLIHLFSLSHGPPLQELELMEISVKKLLIASHQERMLQLAQVAFVKLPLKKAMLVLETIETAQLATTAIPTTPVLLC